jgi:hypothetical protein
MVTGPLITHALGLSGLFWLIALLALAAIAIVPGRKDHGI